MPPFAAITPFPGRPFGPDRLSGALPAPPTAIIGREREVERVLGLLDCDDLRVLTLLGTGGVGKTRLALEVAWTMAPDFADGARFVALEAIRAPELVPDAAAKALGIQGNPSHTTEDLLVEFLAGRHMLLVLDNFEQVVSAASWLSGLLARCPRIKVLVTSRIALDIGGEQRFVVPPLQLSDASDAQSPAVELFAARAKAVNLGFEMDGYTAPAVAEICRQLEGLPLAIELAAAQVNVLSPHALLARLTDRLTVLTGGRRDAPVRLRSMRDAIRWSYDLLSEAEQRLFRRLAVFHGGFTLEAAAFVAAWPEPSDGGTAARLVGSLVNQSLVQTVDGPVESRFRMLDTIREYGVQEAQDRGESEADRHAHAEYFRSLARRAEVALTGPQQAAWLDRLQAEHPDIREAMTWLEANARLDDAIELCFHIMFFLIVRVRAVEMARRLGGWLEGPSLAGRTRSRGLALTMAGVLAPNTGEFARSVSMLTEAVGILREVGDRGNEALALSLLSSTYSMTNDFERMRHAATSAVAIAEPLGLHRPVGISLKFLAVYAYVNGDTRRARELLERGMHVTSANGDLWALAFHLRERLFEALREGHLEEAQHVASESLNLQETLRSRRDLAHIWGQLAWIARQRGDLDRAVECAATGLAIAESCGHTWMAALLRLYGGIFAADRGELVEACVALADAFRWYAERAPVIDTAQCLDAYALLAIRAGDADRAARFLGACCAVMDRGGLDRDHLDFEATTAELRQSLPAALGVEAYRRAHAEGAMLSIDAAVAEALAYVPVVASPVDPAVSGAGARRAGLSPRELDVLTLMASGYSNQQIADELFLSLRTVTSHVTHILTKLDVASRTAAVAFAIRSGLA